MAYSFCQLLTLSLIIVVFGSCGTFQHAKYQYGSPQTQQDLHKQFGKDQVSDQTIPTSEDQSGQYFGAYNIFLQPQEKYILVPALLFGTQSSFKKDYQLQIVQEANQTTLPLLNQQNTQKPTLFEIYPALQKLNTYNLTAVQGLNVTDCGILQVYFQDDDTPFIVCLRKSHQLQVHRVDISDIYFEFSFRVSYLWNKMNIISTNEIFFYNASYMQFYTYNQEMDTVIVKEFKMDQSQSIMQCETYIQDNPTSPTIKLTDQINQEKYYQICYTNNNQVSLQASPKLYIKLNQIKKEYVIMFLLDVSTIQQLTSFEIPQKNSSSFNHIVGFDIIDSLQKVIMMCYNLYKLNIYDNSYAQQTQFVSSYCSIFKIYLIRNEMVLINRMQLENTTFPLLQTSLQISVMLTVATQNSITFYHLDVLKQRFQFIQQILVPEKSNFNCYELSELSNSYSSVSLTCAKDQDQSKTVSFVMIFDEDVGKYVPVGDVFVGVDLFHSAQLIFTLNQKELTVLKANQEYAIFDYSEDKIQVRVYEIDNEKPDERCRYASIIMNPAQYTGIYVDQVLPLIQQINYDAQYELSLRGAFQGSNISYLKVQAVDSSGEPINSTMIKNDKIFFYQYFLLVSVYIKQQCIRIIKISDVSFYRILQIEKSRVVDLQDDNVQSNQSQAEKHKDNPKNLEDDGEEYYYYTQICSKLNEYYICELTELNSSPKDYRQKNNEAPQQEPNVLRLESTKQKKLLAIEFLSHSDTFVYLYQLQNDLSSQSSQLQYGLIFVNILHQVPHPDSLQCLALDGFIQELIPTENLLNVQLKKDWFILKHTFGHVFCLLTQVQTFLFNDNRSDKGFSLTKGCIFHTKTQNTNLKYFVQESTLILSQTSLNSQNKTRNITIYSIFSQQTIIKKGSYKMTETLKNYQHNSTLKDDEQFIGLYRQYIIIVNSTTIRKFYLQVDLQLVYEFTFNPEFDDSTTSVNSHNKIRTSYPIKYVLFLEKYLIAQFEQFYQLYNIGQQLISIQIAANNFKTYLQGVSSEKRQKFESLKNNELPQNVIINDAFLIEGDNIIIYEKDHLLVAKYVTNPTFELGSIEQSQSVVETNLELRLRPISDISNFEDVYQEIMFKIIYSHYEVQNIAKNIKTLTVPSVTQNYELQIWTFVFRGPVIQYYLSDNFDGQIVLKQHLTEKSDNLAHLKDKETPFAIIQYHRPYGGVYVIKTNISHLLIETKSTKQSQLVEIPNEVQNSTFLKHLEVSMPNGRHFICLLSIDKIIFVKRQAEQNKGQGKLILWKIFAHNISINPDPLNPIPQTQFQLIAQENQQNSFNLIIKFSNQIMKYSQKAQTENNNHFNWFLFSPDDEKDDLTLLQSQKVILNDSILQIRAIDSSSQIFILTQMQQLIIFQSTFDQNQTKFLLKQSINLKNVIPASYRSNKNYLAFQIFQINSFGSPKTFYKKQSNMTMLLFAENDEAFHIEFEVYETINDQNISIYQLRVTNIYASYLNFNFLQVVQIGFDFKDSSGRVTKLPYLYFVILCEYETSLTPYLFYFGYNHNFTQKGQVGYFKCGEEISVESSKSRHIQNGLNLNNTTRKSVNSLQNVRADAKNYYFYSIDSMGQIQVQISTVTIGNSNEKFPNSNISYNIEVGYDRTYSVNTTIYMKMNYKKPPIVTYILLNARNFNTRSGIYTKFVFLKDEQTWMGFYITFPLVLVFFIGFGCLLKKYQPKQVLRRKKHSQPEVIFSDTSRSSQSKQQQIIHILDDDSQDQSNSNRQSLMDEGKFGTVYNQHKTSEKSSLLESPFKSHYGSSRDLEDLSESEIDHSEQVKLEFHAPQDREILAYLISKNDDNKKNRSSFA